MQVTEHIIEEALSWIHSSSGDYESAVKTFGQEQPAILSALFTDDFDLFTQEEKDFALFLAMVIWKSITSAVGSPAEVSADRFGEVEENNWELLQTTTGKSFRDRMNVFFEQTEEEDLLAFIEDSLTPGDEEEFTLTAEGREPLFVFLKSVVDSMLV